MKIRSALKIISWLVISMVTACALAWFYLQPLAIAATRPLLAPYGIELIALEGYTLKPDSLSVKRIALRMPEADGSSGSAAFHDVNVTFSLDGLLKRRIEQLSIGSIQLDGLPVLPAEPPELEQNPAQRLRLETLIATMRELPLDSLAIDHLTIPPYVSDAAITVTRSDRELHASLDARQASIDLRMNWPDDEIIPDALPSEMRQANIVPSRTLTGSLRIERTQDSVAVIDFSADEVSGLLQLNLATQLQVSPLHQLLQDLQLTPAMLPDGNYQGQLLTTLSAREQAADESVSSQRFDFELTVEENSSLSAPLPAYPGARSARLDWQGNAALTLAGSWQPQTGAVLLNGTWQPVDVTVIADEEEKQFRIGLHQLALDCSGRGSAAEENSAKCTFLQSSDVQMQDFAIGDLVLEDVRAITNSTLDSSSAGTTMQLGPGSRIAIGHARAPGMELNDANFLVQDAVDVSIDSNGVVDLSSNGLELYLPDVQVADMTAQGIISAAYFRAHIPVGEPAEIGAEISVRDMGVEPLPLTPRRPEFNAALAYSGDQVNMQGVLRVANIALLEINASHDIASGNGDAQLQIPTLQFDELFTNLQQLFINFPYPADFIAGSIDGSSDLHWQLGDDTQLQGNLRIEVDGLSGYYQEIAIVGLNAVAAGQLSEEGFISDGTQTVSIASVDPGMPINNITLDYQLDTPAGVAILSDLHADMFNGSIEASDIHYDFNTVSTDFELQLQSIDLTRILSLASYDGVRATGLFSGNIPISIKDGVISVADGAIGVLPPGGIINYISPTGTNTGNPSLDLVNQALSNYQYDVLQAEVNYLPDGELAMSMQLQGLNPDMGQRINLNLNISDNIPALLQSLQAGRNITDAVQEGLENRQRNQRQ